MRCWRAECRSRRTRSNASRASGGSRIHGAPTLESKPSDSDASRTRQNSLAAVMSHGNAHRRGHVRRKIRHARPLRDEKDG